jgi:hypothetical protein
VRLAEEKRFKVVSELEVQVHKMLIFTSYLKSVVLSGSELLSERNESLRSLEYMNC